MKTAGSDAGSFFMGQARRKGLPMQRDGPFRFRYSDFDFGRLMRAMRYPTVRAVVIPAAVALRPPVNAPRRPAF